MCMGSKTPAPKPPAPAPAPPPDPVAAPEINETAASERRLLSAKRSGRNSLRIDPIGSNATGSGLNIPVV